MNIVFLCGSLEPGRDGVGDYSRRFGVELIRQGHNVSLIALHDHYVLQEIEELQVSDGIPIAILRISNHVEDRERFLIAKNFIGTKDPEWISLQFVPFAFQEKGLPFKLASQLKILGEGRKWHIMFHELWVGMSKGSSFKHLLLGRMQKHLVKDMLIKLKPAKTHTQTQLYKLQLAYLKVHADYLPLFSNIPDLSKNTSTINLNSEASRGSGSIAIFGTIHPNAPVEDLAFDIARYCRERNKKIIVNFIGRVGAEQHHWVEVMTSAGVTLKVWGEQPSEMISSLLKESLIGVSTTSLSHIEKSGTVAAMLEHGLTVLCVSKRNQFNKIHNLDIPAGIIDYKAGYLEPYLSKKVRFQFNNTVSQIAVRFVNSVNSSNKS
jgi:hypothetical protein